MDNLIEDIFVRITDNKEILPEINSSLLPILKLRKEAKNTKEYSNQLSFCVGYHLKMVGILKTIITNYFIHNTITDNLNKEIILQKVDGIMSSEADADKLIELTNYYFSKSTFNSSVERDTAYIMTCMKNIIESCLMLNFIEYVSMKKPNLSSSSATDKALDEFYRMIEKYTDIVMESIAKAAGN
jgi:hypothetical protein